MRPFLCGALLSVTLLAVPPSGPHAGEAGEGTSHPVVAPRGCGMAHCDVTMSDQSRMWTGDEPSYDWADFGVQGSGGGLGCSSNGEFFVCSFMNSNPSVRAYDADGNVLWDDGGLLDSTAWTSAPLILDDGSAIAADSSKVVRFAADGTVLWNTPTPGGLVISPVSTANGFIFLATAGGPVSTYDLDDGTLADSVTLTHFGNTYSTGNTPCVEDNRVYVLADVDDPTLQIGRLFALDVGDDGTITQAWEFRFRSPSGGSPVVHDGVVFFDGSGAFSGLIGDPHLFAVRDLGTTRTLEWKKRIVNNLAASMALDPRGGLWSYPVGSPSLVRYSEQDGTLLQDVDLSQLVADSPGTPQSVITVNDDLNGPTLLLFVAKTAGGSHLIAVNVKEPGAEALRWQRSYDPAICQGQMATVRADSNTVVTAFSTHHHGVRAVRGGADFVDLSLTHVVDDPAALPGATVTFTVTLTNAAGYHDGTGVEVTNLLPSGYTYLSDDSGSSGTSYDPATGIWQVDPMPSGQSVALQVTATVRENGSYENVAEVTRAEQPDWDDIFADGAGDDHASASVAPGAIRTLAVTRQGDDLLLQWPSTGASTYRVYDSPDPDAPKGQWSLAAEVTETSWVDAGAASDPALRYYSVVEVNGGGEGPH